MSSVRQRGEKWQARVTVAGETATMTFSRKADAEKWCRHTQVLMERGESPNKAPKAPPLAQAIARFESEVLPQRRGSYQEKYLLAYWARSALASIPIHNIKPEDIAAERDKILKNRSTGTARRYLDALSAVFSTAKSDWGWVRANPILDIRKPPNGKPRERRLAAGELDRIMEAASQSPDLRPIIELSLETGMRRSEILGLEWRYIDLQTRTVFLPITKNGDSRCVPLTQRAANILAAVDKGRNGKVFKKNPSSLSSAFQRAVQRARRLYEAQQISLGSTEDALHRDPFLVDLRLHDLRHERISSLVEAGFNLIETAAISGHKTMQCLKRYTHVRPAHLIAKLDALSERHQQLVKVAPATSLTKKQ